MSVTNKLTNQQSWTNPCDDNSHWWRWQAHQNTKEITYRQILKTSEHTRMLLLLLLWRARQALPIWGDKDVPKRWGIPPDSESGGIRLSLVIADSHFIDWGTTQRWLSLPTADIMSSIVKRSMWTDVDKLSSCSRFSDSVVGFPGQKTQPTASKYCRSIRGRVSRNTQTERVTERVTVYASC